MNPGMSFKHLLVDLDGTLLGARNVPLHLEFIRRAIHSLRGHAGWRKSLRSLWGVYAEITTKNPSPVTGLTNDRRVVERFAQSMRLAPDEARAVLRASLLELFPKLERHFYPQPGAAEFLDWARTRYPLTLATNPVWPIDIIRLRVAWAGLDATMFGAITHAGMMHSWKPSAHYYREILEKVAPIKDAQPGDYLLVGDHVSMDLPATRVGIPVFIVKARTPFRELTLSGARAPAWTGSFADLRKMLEGAS